MSDDAHPLDRLVWDALTTRLAYLAIDAGRARRLDPRFGPFAATIDDDPESFAQLHELAKRTGNVVLFTPEPPPLPPTFEVLMASKLDQFVGIAPGAAPKRDDMNELSAADAPEMVALAELTKPGPFLLRTHELGVFFGVRFNGRLGAMAGERFKLPGFTEISGVCTHPDFRGQGLAAALIGRVAEEIQSRGETPFLHVFSHNAPAIAVYERLGMKKRRSFAVTFVRAI